MAWESVAGPARLIGYRAGLVLKSARSLLDAGALARWRWPVATPERLLIAPQDIRTTDPTQASDIYAGVFAFAGETVETEGRSPFEVRAPSEAWAQALHGFGWLRHLGAADGALTRVNARALVDDWIRLSPGPGRLVQAPEVLARRILSWLSQAPLILDGADYGFYRRFLKSLVKQVRRLRGHFLDAPEGQPRLIVAIALASAALSLSGQNRLLALAARRLGDELDRQILPDGGHVSRNPAAILELLVDLLPLKQAYTARSIAPPAALHGAIERMMPMLRFFRHPDGSFAHFNGVTGTPADLVAAVLAHDESRGRPVSDASYSGYQRLDAQGTAVILDAGRPPPLPLSGEAHAGCLSFELGTAAGPLIVNCGATHASPVWRRAARATAAHSTLSIGGESSCRFVRPRRRRRGGEPILSGPRDVRVGREADEAGETLTVQHDGYQSRVGFIHQRALRLSPDGTRLDGSDRLIGEGRRRAGARYDIRFHLAPAARAVLSDDGAHVLVTDAGGAVWAFTADGLQPAVEESVAFSDVHGIRRAQQIVLSGDTRQVKAVAWSLVKLDETADEG